MGENRLDREFFVVEGPTLDPHPRKRLDRGMKYWINKKGTDYGPYSLEELKKYVEDGEISPGDSACEVGRSKWVSVEEILASSPRSQVPSAPKVNPIHATTSSPSIKTTSKSRSSLDSNPPHIMTKIQANIIIFLLLVGLGFPFLGSFKPAPKWEYKVETPSDSFFTSSMNRLGDEGWELVTARRASGALGVSYECILKKRK